MNFKTVAKLRTTDSPKTYLEGVEGAGGAREGRGPRASARRGASGYESGSRRLRC